MEKYLIMVDLDGTFLNNKSKISLKSLLYIRKLAKKGHYFVIASGRPYQGCIKFYKKLNIKSPLVCDNGGAIHFPFDHSKDIFTLIPLEIYLNLMRELKTYILFSMGTSFEKIYYYNRKEVPSFIQHLTPQREIIEGYFDEVVKNTPINTNIFVKNEDVEKILNIFKKEEYKNIISYRKWKDRPGLTTFEIFHKNATKGQALTTLKEMLSVKEENDLVFGDQMNDLEMIRTAYNGVAMLNGKKEIKDAAKYITYKTNNKNGVIHFIKEYFKKSNR